MKNNLLTNIKEKTNFIAVILLLSLLFMTFLSLEVSAASDDGGGSSSGSCTPVCKVTWYDIIDGEYHYYCKEYYPLPPECTSDGDSCFLAGTPIALSDGTEKPIEDIKVGNIVLGYDLNANKKVNVKVLELESPVRDDYYIIEFKDGSKLEVTNEHPIYIKNNNFKGWGSIIPKITLDDTGMIVNKINVGDQVLKLNNKWVEIINIIHVKERVQTYNLKKVSKTNTFFAGGVLVHNKYTYKGCSGNICKTKTSNHHRSDECSGDSECCMCDVCNCFSGCDCKDKQYTGADCPCTDQCCSDPDCASLPECGGVGGGFCGDETCGAGENYDNCCDDCPCPAGQSCVDGECVEDTTTCTCGSWVSGDCGEWTCSNCERVQRRNCDPNGCDTETRCVAPSYGSCVYDNECDTTGSQTNSCGCTKTCTRTVSSPYTSGGDEDFEDGACSDGIDNDCDGLTDSEDPDCASLYVDVVAMSNFYFGEIPIVLLNTSNPFGLASGNLILSVLDEDNNLVDSCSQTISLSSKIFFGNSVKNAHFYQWAESVLLTEEEIDECNKGEEKHHMDDECKHHSSTEETFYNYGEDEFYKKYPDLLILEDTSSYLQSSDFVEIDMPNCEPLFKSLNVIYNLTASLEVIE